MPKAMASRACAHQNASARYAPAEELRAAVVCLINQERDRWQLPALRQQSQLDRAAQSHDDQMVAGGFFAHSGAGSNPGSRLTQVGFPWSALGEAIATGFPTPRRAVRAWLASTEHCQIMLSPMYRVVGVGANPSPVRGFANRPGTWTADFALAVGSAPPSSNFGPANGCPY
jgi:uncharacterized protein YkwD